MKTAVLAITSGGRKLAQRISAGLTDSHNLLCEEGIARTVRKSWKEYDGFIFVMASGIVVRSIAPLLENKRTDPCVVVCDESGQFAISMLSGHLGGGNALAEEIAKVVGGQAVITTASDILGHTAVDMWARTNALVPENDTVLTTLSSILIDSGKLRILSDIELGVLPADFVRVDDGCNADLIVSVSTDWQGMSAQFLRPLTLAVGIGCNRGTSSRQIQEALAETLIKHALSFFSISTLASIDLKADEQGLIEFAETKKMPIQFYSSDELNKVAGLKRSQIVYQSTGAYGVSEPAAILASGGGKLIVEKTKWSDVTIAIAEKK
jgi:cobalt-precorrin 5A hydrolase